MRKHSWIVKRQGDTRRQRDAKVRATFGPLHALVADLRTGFVDSIKGEPILKAWDYWMPVAETLTSVANCFARIDASLDLSALHKVAKRLGNGAPITEAEIDALEAALRAAEAVYRVRPLAEIRNAIRTEEIAIELQAMGVAA